MSAASSGGAREKRAAERVACDHRAACGRCGDQNDQGAERCGCGALLYVTGMTPPKSLAHVLQEEAEKSVRALLGIVWCATCGCDTMPLDYTGRCGFCNTKLVEPPDLWGTHGGNHRNKGGNMTESLALGEETETEYSVATQQELDAALTTATALRELIYAHAKWHVTPGGLKHCVENDALNELIADRVRLAAELAVAEKERGSSAPRIEDHRVVTTTEAETVEPKFRALALELATTLGNLAVLCGRLESEMLYLADRASDDTHSVKV